MGAETSVQRRRIEVPPSPCISAVDGFGWTPPVVVAAGEYELGVRARNDEGRQLLATLLADRLAVPADVDQPTSGPDAVPRNVSVQLADEPEPGALLELHRLYLGHHVLLRTRDPRRVLHALLATLDAHAAARTDGLPLLCATVLVGHGAAHVLPNEMRRAVVERNRRIRGGGYHLVDHPWVPIDVTSGTVIVPEVDGDVARAELPARVASGAEDPPVPAGSYPIGSWDPLDLPTAGAIALAAARSIVNIASCDVDAVLPGLVGLLARTPGRAAGPLAEGYLDDVLAGGSLREG